MCVTPRTIYAWGFGQGVLITSLVNLNGLFCSASLEQYHIVPVRLPNLAMQAEKAKSSFAGLSAKAHAYGIQRAINRVP